MILIILGMSSPSSYTWHSAALGHDGSTAARPLTISVLTPPPAPAAPQVDLREEGELEWDSEEYTDVEAIILAELLKAT